MPLAVVLVDGHKQPTACSLGFGIFPNDKIMGTVVPIHFFRIHCKRGFNISMGSYKLKTTKFYNNPGGVDLKMTIVN